MADYNTLIKDGSFILGTSLPIWGLIKHIFYAALTYDPDARQNMIIDEAYESYRANHASSSETRQELATYMVAQGKCADEISDIVNRAIPLPGLPDICKDIRQEIKND